MGASCKPGETFLQSIVEKEQLVSPVKDRGNANFKNSRYRAAIADYSRAIKLCPYSPVLYCNRAMSYLKSGNYWCACVDSYRALVLKPEWEKAYYRCAEAWIKLGNIPAAVSVNHSGQRLCIEHSDLDRQLKELQGQNTAERPLPLHPVRVDHQSPQQPQQQQQQQQQQNNIEKTTEDSGAGPPGKPIENSGSGPPGKGTEDGKGGENSEAGETAKSGSGKGTGSAPPGGGGDSSTKPETQRVKTDNGVTSQESVPEIPAPKVTESVVTNQTITAGTQPRQPIAGPYEDFVALQCPIVDRNILTYDLQRYSQEVKLHYFTPAIYTKHSAAWEKYDEDWEPVPKPQTDPETITAPMLTVQFDEIWCPIPADFEPAETILPPTFTYMPTDKCSPSKPDYMIVKTSKVDGE